MTQSELTRYAKAMRAAGYDDWRIDVAKAGRDQGLDLRSTGGETANDGDHIDRMIERLP